MQGILHFFIRFSPWKHFRTRERRRLERKVDAGTKRAIAEYSVTLQKLKEYDRR